MAANTRYEPAPQRDSLDDPSYSQAPPSYQATAVPAEPAPRSEDDNLPDDFKVCTYHAIWRTFTQLERWKLTKSHSSEVPWPKERLTSVCNSFARCTLSCKLNPISKLRPERVGSTNSLLTLLTQNGPTPPHNDPKLNLLLQRLLPRLDPVQLLVDDNLRIRRSGLHACNILEAKVLPSKPPLPIRFHNPRSVLDQRGDIFLRRESSGASARTNTWNLRRLDPLRMPDQVRLH